MTVNDLHLCTNPYEQNLKLSIGDCPIGLKYIKMYELEGALQQKVSFQGGILNEFIGYNEQDLVGT